MNLRLVVAMLACASLTACAAGRERNAIRHGLLTTEIRQQAFLDAWGAPTRTSVIRSEDDVIKAGIAPFQGAFFSSKDEKTYEVWNYEGRKTVLVFDEHELVAWSTSETVQELAAQR
jgi:hypothetical protein